LTFSILILGVAALARAVLTIVVGVVCLLSGQLTTHGIGRVVLLPFLYAVRKFVTGLVRFVVLVEDVVAFAVRKARVMLRWRVNWVGRIVIVWLIRCGGRQIQIVTVGFGFLAQRIGEVIKIVIEHAVFKILALLRPPITKRISAPSQVVARTSSTAPVGIVAIVPRALARAPAPRHGFGATPLFAFQIPFAVRILIAVSLAQTAEIFRIAVPPWMLMQFFFVPTGIRIIVMVLSLVGLAEILLVLGSFLGLIFASIEAAIFALALLATVHAARHRRGG